MAKKSITGDMMVSVVVCTYNQEQWIRQTLDSILAQQTDYPFEIIIGEDHGTDGTRVICQEYADKYANVILLPSDKNVGVTANWLNCIKHSHGKYLMGCAGDDFWHNPDKLQLQVDFMETHPECVMCHTDYNALHTNTDKLECNVNLVNGIVPPEGKIQQYILRGTEKISAVTTCYRLDTFNRYIPTDKYIELQFPREDWPTMLILSAHGDIRYLPVSTATYRVGQESITRTSNYEKIIERAQKDKEMTEYLYSLFPEWGPFEDGPFFDHIGYHHALYAAYRNNDYAAAKKYAKLDKYPTKATKMAKTWVTFKLFRLLQKYRNRL